MLLSVEIKSESQKNLDSLTENDFQVDSISDRNAGYWCIATLTDYIEGDVIKTR